MRRTILLLALGLLAVPAVPVTAQTTCPCTVTDTFSVAGDTVVLELETPSGQTTFQPGSGIVISGAYPGVRSDAAVAFAFGDGFFFNSASVLYARGQAPGETLVHLGDGSGPTDAGLHLNGPGGFFTEAGVEVLFDGVEVSQGRWLVTLSVPEASSLSVDVDLTTDQQISYTRGPANSAGHLAAPADQTGGAQVIQGSASAAVAHGTTAQAPDGTRGYALMIGDPDARITGVYGIDGPGSADHTVAAVDAPPPSAFVLGGPSGTYSFDQDVVATRDASAPSPVAVFFAAQLSF